MEDGCVPFPDELSPAGVVVHPYRAEWQPEAAELAATLRRLVPDASSVVHIGSTSIPGRAAKDCLDMMVLVTDPEPAGLCEGLVGAGYRQRPEPWNLSETADGQIWPKRVFAPPAGSRRSNIHLRPAGSGSARLALLFRDYLRANPHRVIDWSEFKMQIARHIDDLAAYGQIKLPAWRLLMELAERWARETGWDAAATPQCTA